MANSTSRYWPVPERRRDAAAAELHRRLQAIRKSPQVPPRAVLPGEHPRFHRLERHVALLPVRNSLRLPREERLLRRRIPIRGCLYTPFRIEERQQTESVAERGIAKSNNFEIEISISRFPRIGFLISNPSTVFVRH